VLALCAPLLIPGLHPSKLLSSGPGIGGTGGSGGGGGTGLPGVLSQTISALREKHTSLVLTYTTNASRALQANDPQYLRQYVFDKLTDSGWASSDYSAGATQITSIPGAPGLTNTVTGPPVTTRVDVTGGFTSLSSTPVFLPVPYPPISVSAPPGVWLIDPAFMVFSGEGASIGGKSYTVTSLAVNPTALQLSQAPAPALNVSADLQLPPSYRLPALRKLAQQITTGADSEYAKADALAIWLANHGTYNTRAPGLKDAADLVTFLTKTRSGVCVQFAWSMTVLARLLGLPARMAAGYTAGEQVKGQQGHYVVTTQDDHAWPELYFQGYGWIRFEPTPAGQGTSSSPDYMKGVLGSGRSGTGGPPVLPNTVPSAAPTPGAAAGGFHNRPLDASGPAARPHAKSAGTPWAALILAVIAAIALAGGIIAMVLPAAHRSPSRAGEPRRRRRTVTGPIVVLAAAAAALVALSLYRLLSHVSGLGLGAGWAMVGMAFGAACAAMLVAPALCRAALRRWRWMRATDDVSRAHVAWREFREDLADFGQGYQQSEPPRTLADRVTAGLPGPAGEAVRRLALAEERASYSARPADSATLRHDGAAARRGLAARAGRGARWRARIFPVSLMTSMADGASQAHDRLLGLPALGRRVPRSQSLHPAVALLPATPPLFHPLHQPGPPGLARTPGRGRPARPGRAGLSRDGPAARGAYPPHRGQVPPPADHRPGQRQHQERSPGRLKVDPAGDHARRERATPEDHPDKGLRQLALVVHTRVARAHQAPEPRILPVERLLDLLQLALLMFRERHDASQKPLRPARVRWPSPHTRFIFQNTSVDTPLGRVHLTALAGSSRPRRPPGWPAGPRRRRIAW
jgi:transglutaminase-like putative cysteine protease